MNPLQSENPAPPLNPSETGINYREQVIHYIRKWPWFLLSLIVFISLAFLYMRYTIPQYEVNSTILINEDEGSSGSEMMAFQDLGFFDNTQSMVENEVQILKSRSLMLVVAKKLRLNVQYFSEGTVLEFENYTKSLVDINFLSSDSLIYRQEQVFDLRIKSKTDFTLLNNNKESGKDYSFGKPILTSLGKIIITPTNQNIQDRIGDHIKVVITPIQDVAELYRNKLIIEPVEQGSAVLSISLNDPVEEKARDIVNTLVEEYNMLAIEDNKAIAKKTSEFINERITLITTDLSSVDTEAAEYKSNRGLTTDLGAQTQRLAETNMQNNRAISELNTQISLIQSMRQYTQSQGSNYDIVPANLGFSDPAVTNLVSRYNELVLNRNRILENSTLQNPTIINLDQQLNDLRQSLLASLNNLQESTKIKLSSLQTQDRYFSGRLYSAPKEQQALKEIERQSLIKEQLYLYLLQKREEAEISSAVSTANAKVIDPAIITEKSTLFPPKKIIVIGTLFMGLFVPFLVIYISGLLSVKVNSKQDLEKVLTTPIIGDIPKSSSKSKMVVSKTSRSAVAESFRILRTNLDFLMAGISSDRGKIIFTTSTVSGEGKTFISSNLAKVLAVTGKKVVYIGTDLRDPKFHLFLDLPNGKNSIGVTNYITDKKLNPSDVIHNLGGEDSFDIIPSGAIPPNPSELLMNIRVKELFSYLQENYDFIVVDTAPVQLVTDTLLISNMADLVIYIVRAHYLDKRLLPIAESLYKDKRLPNMAVLLNGTDYKKGYGYGYGYGYGKMN